MFDLSNKCIEHKNDTLYALIYRDIARTYSFQNKFEQAINYLLLSNDILKNQQIPSNSEILIRNYYFLGQYNLFLDNKEKALLYYDKTIEQVNKQSNVFVRASMAYKDQADIYLKIGDYYRAIAKSEFGVKFGVKANNIRFTAQNLWVQAMAFYEIRNFIQAEEVINKAIEITTNNNKNDYDLGSYWAFKGDILSERKDFGNAFKCYLKAEKVLISYDYPPDLGQIYSDIGNMYFKAKNYILALKYYYFALNSVTEKQDKIKNCTKIAETYFVLNQPQKGIDYFKKGIEYSGNFKKSLFKDYIFQLYGSFAKNQTAYAKTLKNIEVKNKELFNASRNYLIADKLIEYMRHEQTGSQSKFYWRNKTRSIYESAIETCYLLQDYEKAFYFFEKSRSVLLNDKLNELGAKQKLSEEDFQKEKDFLKQITELNAAVEKASTSKQKSDLNNKLLDLQEQQGSFIKSLENKNPAYYRMKYDTSTVSLKQFQNYLASFKGQAVEYFIGDAATYAIVVSPNSVSLKKLTYNTSNTQQFLDFCSKSINTKTELNEFLSISSDIYKSLVQPLNLQKRRLIISQDGAFMPFEALSKSITKPQYLVQDFMISYIYSAQFLLRQTQKSTFSPQNKFLGIAPVNYKTQKQSSLNGSAESLNNIAKRYFWSSQYVGKQGSKKAFLLNAKKYQIVQIYTHAFADSNYTEPRIYFADSTLKVSELNSEEQFKTNLLVLSACKTGVGKVAKGEGVLSLARGFSMVGIPATITSLWSIEDTDTYKLTELFYQYLNQGLPKDEALQKAKIDFISSNENPMPNTWAGMILIGDSSAISSNYWYVWLLAGFILMIIATGIWYWRKKIRPLPFKQRL